MEFTFVPMNRDYASKIVDTWKYENEYAIYDYINEDGHMLDAKAWGKGIFAALDQAGELSGELSLELIDPRGEFIEYRDFDNAALSAENELWIGFGLRPDLIAKGHGLGFVVTCVEYATRTLHYPGEYIRLGVALFNQRAIKTYQRASFQVFEQEDGEISGKTFKCVHMRKKNFAAET